ncbi:hypothetical protein [Actinoplanes couchii]|uniref:Lipoprotein n=1 Tax=Actinoplanes couchii TaxID=403638 RepID=A0ABQ3XHA7_9ACTN|nr:hypothetical protein [Actinoplanes couchii]MDR6320637.1 hypothetical protein [Actinoplanes couchii]GID57877.1 hypothetical protein Aco03nite_062810 [Actinoplanes couchii]
MRSRVLLVAAIALTAMSACGSTPAEEKPAATGKVATLQSAAPSAAPSKADQRPRERLDTTPEEFELLMAPYNKCMGENGWNPKGDGSGSMQLKPGTAKDEEQWQKANKICEPQYMPLPPWEKDPANPEARDFAVAVVKCLKKAGVEYVAVSDDGIGIALGGDDNDSKSISLGMEKIPDCERQVAAKK